MTDNMDNMMPIKELKERIKTFIDERDWGKYHHPKELAISITIEVAELLEIFQWDEKRDIEGIKNDRIVMNRIKEEVADILMYVISLSNQLDIDLSDAVLAKLEKNRIKYDKNIVLETGAYRKDKI